MSTTTRVHILSPGATIRCEELPGGDLNVEVYDSDPDVPGGADVNVTISMADPAQPLQAVWFPDPIRIARELEAAAIEIRRWAQERAALVAHLDGKA